MLVPSWTTARLWDSYTKKNPHALEVFEKYKYKCADCNTDSKKLLIHHVDNSRKNGELNNSIENLVLLCHSCHEKRHNKNPSKDILTQLQIDKYVGIEYDIIIVEELNQLTEDKYTKLRGSLRTSKAGWRPR